MDGDHGSSHVHLAFLQIYECIPLTSVDHDRAACTGCNLLLCSPNELQISSFLTECVQLCRDKYTSRPRGFGFLTLSAEEAATQICQDTHILDGRQVGSTARQCRPYLLNCYAKLPLELRMDSVCRLTQSAHCHKVRSPS